MSKAAAVSKGTAVESAQQMILAECHRHLPSVDAVGTFSFGKRVSTPSGKPVAPVRPCSAVAARTRGVSVGAEESALSRGDGEARAAACRVPSVQLLDDLERWMLAAQRQLRAEAVPSQLRLVGNTDEILASLAPVRRVHAWHSGLMRAVRHRQQYPQVALAVPDVAHRGPLDRLATLLHAIAQFKLLVDRNRVPDLHGRTPAGSRCELRAASAAALFGKTLQCAPREGTSSDFFDRIVGGNYDAKHVSLSIGSHWYAFDIFSPSGAPLFASEIKQRLLEAIEHSSQGAESQAAPPAFLTALRYLSAAPIAELGTWQEVLRGVCKANALALRTLDSALLSVSLVGGNSDDVSLGSLPFLGFPGNDDLGIKRVLGGGASAMWTGTSLQIAMLPNGIATFRANGMFVDLETMTVFASWVSHAANTDPMLSPPPISNATIAAVKRVPLSSLRPSTAGAKGKGATTASQSAAAPSDPDAVLEETSTVLTIPAPPVESGRLLTPISLWLPVSHEASVLAIDLQQPLRALNFTLVFRDRGPLVQQCAHELLELSVVTSVSSVLRTPSDSLPPIVRRVVPVPNGVPGEVTLFGDSIDAAIKTLRCREGRSPVARSEVIRDAVASLRRLSGGRGTYALPAASMLPIVRGLSMSGYIPGRLTLRQRGECAAPADITVVRCPSVNSEAGLPHVLWAFESNSCGPHTQRMSLSYREGAVNGQFLCTVTHRRADIDVASRVAQEIEAIFRAMVEILSAVPSSAVAGK